jgi:hypothetical protein
VDGLRRIREGLPLLTIAIVVSVATCFGGTAQLYAILSWSCRLLGWGVSMRRLTQLVVTQRTCPVHTADHFDGNLHLAYRSLAAGLESFSLYSKDIRSKHFES